MNLGTGVGPGRLHLLTILAALLLSLSARHASADSRVAFTSIDLTTEAMYREIDSGGALEPAAMLKSTPIQEADLDQPQEVGKGLLLVSSLTGNYMQLADYIALASPMRLKSATEIDRISVASYYVKPARGEGFVLFPLVTALDADGRIIATLEPGAGSGTDGNTITNLFKLPTGTALILVHTRPDLVSASFFADKDKKATDHSDAGPTQVGSGALGLILSSALYGYFKDTEVERGEIALAPIGLVRVFRTPAPKAR